jgi:hypothetical protein
MIMYYHIEWKINYFNYLLFISFHSYLQHHSVCPLVKLGSLYPLSPKRVCFSPEPKGGGGGLHTRLRVRRWGSPISDDWRKSLALCLLCGPFSNLLIYLLLWRVYKPWVITSGFLMLMLVSGGEEATHRKWYYQHRLCWRGPRGDG